MDEYNVGGKKLYKTTYSWNAEGNRLSEMQYNHGQSGSRNSGNNGNSNGQVPPGQTEDEDTNKAGK